MSRPEQIGALSRNPFSRQDIPEDATALSLLTVTGVGAMSVARRRRAQAQEPGNDAVGGTAQDSTGADPSRISFSTPTAAMRQYAVQGIPGPGPEYEPSRWVTHVSKPGSTEIKVGDGADYFAKTTTYADNYLYGPVGSILQVHPREGEPGGYIYFGPSALGPRVPNLSEETLYTPGTAGHETLQSMFKWQAKALQRAEARTLAQVHPFSGRLESRHLATLIQREPALEDLLRSNGVDLSDPSVSGPVSSLRVALSNKTADQIPSVENALGEVLKSVPGVPTRDFIETAFTDVRVLEG